MWILWVLGILLLPSVVVASACLSGEYYNSTSDACESCAVLPGYMDCFNDTIYNRVIVRPKCPQNAPYRKCLHTDCVWDGGACVNCVSLDGKACLFDDQLQRNVAVPHGTATDQGPYKCQFVEEGGICGVGRGVVGCMNSAACNYNPEATIPGTCNEIPVGDCQSCVNGELYDALNAFDLTIYAEKSSPTEEASVTCSGDPPLVSGCLTPNTELDLVLGRCRRVFHVSNGAIAFDETGLDASNPYYALTESVEDRLNASMDVLRSLMESNTPPPHNVFSDINPQYNYYGVWETPAPGKQLGFLLEANDRYYRIFNDYWNQQQTQWELLEPVTFRSARFTEYIPPKHRPTEHLEVNIAADEVFVKRLSSGVELGTFRVTFHEIDIPYNMNRRSPPITIKAFESNNEFRYLSRVSMDKWTKPPDFDPFSIGMDEEIWRREDSLFMLDDARRRKTINLTSPDVYEEYCIELDEVFFPGPLTPRFVSHGNLSEGVHSIEIFYGNFTDRLVQWKYNSLTHRTPWPGLGVAAYSIHSFLNVSTWMCVETTSNLQWSLQVTGEHKYYPSSISQDIHIHQPFDKTFNTLIMVIDPGLDSYVNMTIEHINTEHYEEMITYQGYSIDDYIGNTWLVENTLLSWEEIPHVTGVEYEEMIIFCNDTCPDVPADPVLTVQDDPSWTNTFDPTCPVNCLRCKNSSFCIDVPEGSYYDDGPQPCASDCITCSDSLTCDVYNKTTPTGVACPELCSYCEQDNVCIQAIPGYYMFNGTIVMEEDDVNGDPCIQHCARCDVTGECLRWRLGYHGSGSCANCKHCTSDTCIVPVSGYFVNAFGSASPCEANCLQCSDASTCEFASDGFYVFNGSVYEDGEGPEGDCEAHCERCPTMSTCTRASPKYQIIQVNKDINTTIEVVADEVVAADSWVEDGRTYRIRDEPAVMYGAFFSKEGDFLVAPEYYRFGSPAEQPSNLPNGYELVDIPNIVTALTQIVEPLDMAHGIPLASYILHTMHEIHMAVDMDIFTVEERRQIVTFDLSSLSDAKKAEAIASYENMALTGNNIYIYATDGNEDIWYTTTLDGCVYPYARRDLRTGRCMQCEQNQFVENGICEDLPDKFERVAGAGWFYTKNQTIQICHDETVSDGMIGCRSCGDNEYFVNGTKEHLTYAGITAYTYKECRECPNGQFFPYVTPIPRGSCFMRNGSYECGHKNQCVDCAPGSYGADGACVTCPRGFYNDESGMTYCKSCNGIGICDAEGLDTYEACDTDSIVYDDENIPVECALCTDPGTENVNGTCVTCGPGQVNNVPQTELCRYCAPGKYESDHISCKYCAVGRYRPREIWRTEIRHCLDCPLGYYADDIGRSSCTPCAPSKITIETGSTSATDCQSCEVGLIPENGTCLPCADDEIYELNEFGDPRCVICDDPGHHVAVFGHHEECQKCADNTVRPNGQGVREPCTPCGTTDSNWAFSHMANDDATACDKPCTGGNKIVVGDECVECTHPWEIADEQVVDWDQYRYIDRSLFPVDTTLVRCEPPNDYKLLDANHVDGVDMIPREKNMPTYMFMDLMTFKCAERQGCLGVLVDVDVNEIGFIYNQTLTRKAFSKYKVFVRPNDY